MEKIAAKILSCELEKCGDSTVITMYVDYGCQQFVYIPKEVDLCKFLDFFDTYKLSDITGKYCYIIMESRIDIIELQQFPCVGYDILNLRTGQIISEFDRDTLIAEEKEFQTELKEELTKIKATPKYIRKEILEYFRKFINAAKSDLSYWLNSRSVVKTKIIEQ